MAAIASPSWNPIRRRLFPSSAVPRRHLTSFQAAARVIPSCAAAPKAKAGEKKKNLTNNNADSAAAAAKAAALEKAKRRTRSEKKLDMEQVRRLGDGGAGAGGHVPVMLGEVLDVFSSPSAPLRSFVDCTLGAAGHSSAIIQAHPELQLYVGLDIDPVAHEKAKARINSLLYGNFLGSTSQLQVHTHLKNFRNIKSVLSKISQTHLTSGVDGILMDLGMSSMQVDNAARGFSVLSNGPLDMRMDPQAPLKAEDILNSWPETEVGRVLRECGEESNWFLLQKRIIKARLDGGLHSTGELVKLIQSGTPKIKGRQGWIKTATRVFQALRIAVNDELKTLEDSLYACFDCLAPGGRLAVISFHSLEDRIVKQTFLKIINCSPEDEDKSEQERSKCGVGNILNDVVGKEIWIKQMIHGHKGTILTKRPITPSEEEERLNSRCRSAKLRVIQRSCRQTD